jgi:hypothetical protein
MDDSIQSQGKLSAYVTQGLNQSSIAIKEAKASSLLLQTHYGSPRLSSCTAPYALPDEKERQGVAAGSVVYSLYHDRGIRRENKRVLQLVGFAFDSPKQRADIYKRRREKSLTRRVVYPD